MRCPPISMGTTTSRILSRQIRAAHATKTTTSTRVFGLRGSLFIELRNPWSQDGQLPRSLYSKVDSTIDGRTNINYVPSQGVELGRLSNYAANVDASTPLNTKLTPQASGGTIRRSPVWRIIVVEEDPAYRSREYKRVADWVNAPFDQSLKYHSSTSREAAPAGSAIWNLPPTGVSTTDTANEKTAKTIYEKAADAVKAWRPTAASPIPIFRPSDPDFTETFNRGFKPVQTAGQLNAFQVKYPYIEREFYFTSDNSQSRDVTVYDSTLHKYELNPNFKLRIPDWSFVPSNGMYPPSHLKENGDPDKTPWQTQRFIAVWEPNGTTVQDVPLAPIEPGRYGVVGSAGTRYKNAETGLDLQNTKPPLNGPRFIDMIGRKPSPPDPNTKDTLLHPDQTRRIEMRPNLNPNINQLIVADNGGYDPTTTPNPTSPPTTTAAKADLAKSLLATEIGRSNEVLCETINGTNTIQDVYSRAAYQPCVAIPVEGMSASEPPWGWSPREYEASEIESDRKEQAI